MNDAAAGAKSAQAPGGDGAQPQRLVAEAARRWRAVRRYAALCGLCLFALIASLWVLWRGAEERTEAMLAQEAAQQELLRAELGVLREMEQAQAVQREVAVMRPPQPSMSAPSQQVEEPSAEAIYAARQQEIAALEKVRLAEQSRQEAEARYQAAPPMVLNLPRTGAVAALPDRRTAAERRAAERRAAEQRQAAEQRRAAELRQAAARRAIGLRPTTAEQLRAAEQRWEAEQALRKARAAEEAAQREAREASRQVVQLVAAQQVAEVARREAEVLRQQEAAAQRQAEAARQEAERLREVAARRQAEAKPREEKDGWTATLTALITAFGTLATGIATMTNLRLAVRAERRQAQEFQLKFRQLEHQVNELDAKKVGEGSPT